MNDSWEKQLVIKLDVSYTVIIKYICTYQHDYGYHKLNGPAILNTNGYKEWYNNQKLHNQNGPAILNTNGYKAWWVNDELINSSLVN